MKRYFFRPYSKDLFHSFTVKTQTMKIYLHLQSIFCKFFLGEKSFKLCKAQLSQKHEIHIVVFRSFFNFRVKKSLAPKREKVHSSWWLTNIAFPIQNCLKKFICNTSLHDQIKVKSTSLHIIIISGSLTKKLHQQGSSIQYVRKLFRKTNISYPLIRIRTCVYQGVRNVSFLDNFAYVLNG